MHMYPAYRLADVLHLKAISFFALLNEGYRIKYSNATLLAQIGDLSSMAKEDRVKFYQQLEWASTHPSDILNTDEQSSTPEQIKSLLRG